MSFNCQSCGEYFDDPHIVSEDEIMSNEFGLSPEDLADALESVDSVSCPFCSSPDIEFIHLD